MANLTEVYEGIEAEKQRMLGAQNEGLMIRIWDGNWKQFAEVTEFFEADFTFENLDAGSATLTLPLDGEVGAALSDSDSWPTKAMYVTFDKDGARWSGRIEGLKTRVNYQGDREVELSIIHDYIKLKELIAWANPFLPAEVQFPKSWMLFGPARWVVTTTIFVNLLRKNNSLWMVPDDPLNVLQWFDLDMSGWNIAVKPVDFFRDSSPTAIVNSRFKYVHDCIKDVCADAQLTIEARRYLPGDEAPIHGANLRYGCLVLDVQDKSGWNKETAFGGNLVSGLVRAVKRIGSDGLTEGLDYIPRVEFPEEYYWLGWEGSLPSAPWVVLEHGEYTGMESTSFEYIPPGPSQFVTGGSSLPYVNEGIKSAIIGVGGVIGSIFNQSQAGTVAATLLEPLYSDVFMAFMAHKEHARIKEQGWDYPFEHWVDGSDKAYTLSALTSMRQAKYDTRERVSAEVKMHNGAPYWVGPQGYGDFFLGDRVAVHALGMPENKLFVEQVQKLTYTVSADDQGWEIELGKPEFTSGFSYISRILTDTKEALKDQGVW